MAGGRSLNDIVYRFLADTKSLERGNRNAQSSFKKTNTFASTLSKTMGGLAAAFGAREVLGWAKDALQMGMAAEEVESKFKAVFGSARKLNLELSAWGDVAGVTTTKALDLAATFGNLAMAQGISRDDTESLTVKVAELAGDLASFNDTDPETVFFDLNKALLTTEREGMKKYGISLTETEIAQRAMEIAVADGRSEFTKADKAVASYQLAVQQAGVAVGDLDRTSDSAANRQRQLKATFEELQEDIGRELVPAYQDLLTATVNSKDGIVGLTSAVGSFISSSTTFTPYLSDATDQTKSFGERATDAGKGLLELTKSGLKWNVVTGPLVGSLEKLGQHFGVLAEETVDSDLYMSEFKKGMKETAKAIADSAGIADPYLEFLALMRRGIEGVESAAVSGLTQLQLLNGEVSQYDVAGSQAAADALRKSLATGSAGRGHRMQGFATGGVVPGQRGKPRLAVVHGGETISSGRGGDGATVVVNFNGVVGDPVAVAQQIQDLMSLADRTGG